MARASAPLRSTAPAISQEEAQHASLLCARAVPRLLLSVHALCKSTAPASRLFHWARGRGATCQLRPPIISHLSRGMRKRATAVAVSHEEAQHASFLRTRTVLR